MYRGIPTINKHLKRKQQERNRTIHLEHLKNMKSIEVPDETFYPFINNKKKQLYQEAKFTQIERQNRILLQKITGIFTKKQAYTSSRDRYKVNKSLNVSLRKKQLEDIQISNARLLKRLQQRRSQYQVQKMRKDWKKQKEVIKNIANFPVTIFKGKKKNTSTFYYDRGFQRKPFNIDQVYQLSKTKVLDAYTFQIHIRFDKMKLSIIAENEIRNQRKIIEVERGQALQYLRNQCNNDLQTIFNKLRFDGEILYLVSQNLENQNELDMNFNTINKGSGINFQTVNEDFFQKAKYKKSYKKNPVIDIDKFQEQDNEDDESELQKVRPNTELLNKSPIDQFNKQGLTGSQLKQRQDQFITTEKINEQAMQPRNEQAQVQ